MVRLTLLLFDVKYDEIVGNYKEPDNMEAEGLAARTALVAVGIFDRAIEWVLQDVEEMPQ